MKKIGKAMAVLGLAVVVVLGGVPGSVNQVKAAPADEIRAFVSRMYTVALNRDAEEAGLEDWSLQLESKQIDGAGIANGFIMSEEFKNKQLSDQDYVKTLYQTFFDREPDTNGYNSWIAALKKGADRGYVLAGFTDSEEFSNLCESFGILRGYMYSNGDAANPGIGQFVTRLYTEALGREGEDAGINDWTAKIATREKTAEEVATDGFFHSEEFQQKRQKMTDGEFLDVLYATFFDRTADEGGKADWMAQMQAGLTEDEVIQGFARSEEFSNLLSRYGLTTEPTQPTPDETTDATPDPETCNHNYEKVYWPVEPTCTHGGDYYWKCSICGGTKGEWGRDPALPHTPVTVDKLVATYCYEDGIRTTECSVCGEELSRERYSGAIHNWVTGQSDPYWSEEALDFVTDEVTYCSWCYHVKKN